PPCPGAPRALRHASPAAAVLARGGERVIDFVMLLRYVGYAPGTASAERQGRHPGGAVSGARGGRWEGPARFSPPSRPARGRLTPYHRSLPKRSRRIPDVPRAPSPADQLGASRRPQRVPGRASSPGAGRPERGPAPLRGPKLLPLSPGIGRDPARPHRAPRV